MAFTESNLLPLGTTAPDFMLPDTMSGKSLSFNDIKGENGTVVLFLCNHCPYVIHVNSTLVSIANEYLKKGIGFVAISSNDAENIQMMHPIKCRSWPVYYNIHFLIYTMSSRMLPKHTTLHVHQIFTCLMHKTNSIIEADWMIPGPKMTSP